MKCESLCPIGVQKLQLYIGLGFTYAMDRIVRERVPVMAYCEDFGCELPLHHEVITSAIRGRDPNIRAVFKLPVELAPLVETEDFFPKLPPGELLMLDDGDVEERHLYFHPQSQRFIETGSQRDLYSRRHQTHFF